MTISCALCHRRARVYCEADKASLCWICDNSVHSANFIAARHLRRLHCRLCSFISPMASSGQSPRRSPFICHGCHLRRPSSKRIRLAAGGGGNSDEESSCCSYSSSIEGEESSPPLTAEGGRRCGNGMVKTAADVRMLKDMEEECFEEEEEELSETASVA